MKKRIVLAACLGLSACGDLSVPLPGLLGERGEVETTVTRDAVVLAGPHGFCIDQKTSRPGLNSAFVVFGNCRAITGSQIAPQPRLNAVVTSTVRLADPSLPRIDASGSQLTRFFTSDEGKALLSRENNPGTIEIRESGPAKDGSFFLQIADSSDRAPEGTEKTYWRAYLDIKNSLVTVSVLSLENNPLTRDEGLALLRGFASQIRKSQAKEPDPVISETKMQAPIITPSGEKRPVLRPTLGSETPNDPPRQGILGRLFG